MCTVSEKIGKFDERFDAFQSQYETEHANDVVLKTVSSNTLAITEWRLFD
jgi:hypothetical protein